MGLKVSVLGLGYVGCVTAACLAQQGHDVLGVDVSAQKVEKINSGVSTIVEEGIADLVANVVRTGRLSATTDVRKAVLETDISLICVGTPSRSNGSIDLSYVTRVCTQIGEALRDKGRFHTIVIRSTIMPGSIEGVVVPTIAEASGLEHGKQFAVCSNPEFLREGTSIKDFREPPFTIVGAFDRAHAEKVLALYDGIDAPIHIVPVKVAEFVKYTCNCFHALKVGFANEVGSLCKAMGVDSHDVMNIFCEDKKLNISKAYLKPGFAFGGSCLPKDLRAMVHRGRIEDVALPILESILESNRKQIDRAFHLISSTGHKRIGILGLAFKSGTDDLRESPMITLAEMLVGRGFQLLIHDQDVSHANIIGANKEYVDNEIPHLWSMMRPTIGEVIKDSDVVVIGNTSPHYRQLSPVLEGRLVVDLARALSGRTTGAGYHGIGW